MNLVKIWNQISQKSEKIWLLRQDSGWPHLILARGQSSWKRTKRKFWGQKVLFWTKFLKFGPKRRNLATLHSSQIALKIFGTTRTDLALNEQRRLNTNVKNAKVIYIFYWSFLHLPTILMVSILEWITVCIVYVCISYKTINFSMKLLNKLLISHFSFALLYFTFFQI